MKPVTPSLLELCSTRNLTVAPESQITKSDVGLSARQPVSNPRLACRAFGPFELWEILVGQENLGQTDGVGALATLRHTKPARKTQRKNLNENPNRLLGEPPHYRT